MILESIQEFLGGVGNITKSKDNALYWVTSLTDLTTCDSTSFW